MTACLPVENNVCQLVETVKILTQDNDQLIKVKIKVKFRVKVYFKVKGQDFWRRFKFSCMITTSSPR